MAKTKNSPKSREVIPKLPKGPAPPQPPASHAIRETIESIVIAFVLAFLFRTFEAEAFVIPTGSMAPTLMGAHKDVDCLKCGHRFRVNSSEEGNGGSPSRGDTCLGGICPNCHYVNPFRPGLPIAGDEKSVATQRVYNGDRILVNKYLYTVSDPERWDVVVFKYPGDAQMNYIKRLVGLPGETIRVFQGDVFTAKGDKPSDADFQIERKPPSVQDAMRQLVHDTDYDPAQLFAAGWPLRWQPHDGDAAGWDVETEVEELTVRQRYQVDAPGETTSWLRYRHFVPTYANWGQAEAITKSASGDPEAKARFGNLARPQLVTDFNAYNTRITPEILSGQPPVQSVGLHWVGDLMVEADVSVEEAKGELILDLVEAGKHFQATIDLATGKAVLSAEGMADFAPQAETPIRAAGDYHVAFSNFDDELRLWVDGTLIKFDGSTAYDVDQVFGSRAAIIPRTSDEDPGDLAPVGIGARGTKLAVSRLQVWRDIYYVADSWDRLQDVQIEGDVVTDFPHQQPFDSRLLELPYEPALWDRFKDRASVEFPLAEDQFFVMGDNSPASSDARLWRSGDRRGGKPGGAYLERDLLIGKALCVYWPHSWNRIPGTPIPFPLFPNVEDMRLVR